MNVEEAESIFDIDEFALDREWLLQSKYYMKYATALAEARATLDQRKADLDVAIADMELTIRNDPEGYNLKPKPTEASIKAVLVLQPEYDSALRLVNRAKYKVAMISAVVDALEHRKKTLENLVILLGMNYYSEPKDRTNGQVIDQERKRKARKPLPRK